MIIFVLCLFVVASVLWSQKKLMSQSKILRRQQTGKVQAEQIAVAAKAASPVKVPSPVSAWDYIEDGALGNGTKAKVKISIYGEGATASVRLEKVGILEHVPFEEMAAEDRW